MSDALAAMKPLLIGVQTSPERDVSLTTLASEHGYSAGHFHRLFKRATGESPRAHVERVRLERAAYRLAVTRASIIDIALSVGFASHEVFSRAFVRRFGKSPTVWRAQSATAWAERRHGPVMIAGDGCVLSGVSFLTLRTTHLLAWRRVGAYGTFGPPMFDATPNDWSPLVDEARRQRIGLRPLGYVISYDSPFLTPPHLQQLDACAPLVDPNARPQGDLVRRIVFEGGRFGAIEHRGPAQTIVQGYIALVEGIARSGRYRMRDGPPVEILREVSTDEPMQTLTEIYLPVEPV